VARRIEIELTSARPDGTWTWRAAGAREPKGVLEGRLLYEGAKAGDVVKADADFELEGIVVLNVIAPRLDKRAGGQRIEILGSGQPEGPGVTTQLVGRSERRGPRRGDDRPRRDGPRRDGPPREGGPRSERAGERTRRDADRPGRDADRTRRAGPPREGGPRAESQGDRSRRDAPRPDGPRRGGEGAANRPGRPQGDRRMSAEHTSSTADRGRKRLNPGSTHRKAVMDSLAPEEQPVAEQLLRGGIPAVRTALHLEREKAEAEGRSAPNTDALLGLAETLLPRLRAAEWRDRAEAAVAGIDEISLRDLRSVAAGADQARDDETRALAQTLREAIDGRVAKLHAEWVADIARQLDGGRPVRAVRLSSRPPDTSARLDEELTARLRAAAAEMLSPSTAPDLWQSMLEAVADSPIRRAVVPVGLPGDASPELKRAAHQLSGSIPGLAKMLGVTIPPPPVPAAARQGGRRPARTEAGGGPGRSPNKTADAAPVAPPGEDTPPEAEAMPAEAEAMPAEAEAMPAEAEAMPAEAPDAPPGEAILPEAPGEATQGAGETPS
jgi:hypothetical protein